MDARRRGLDPELQVLAKMDRLLAELEPDAIGRTLAWLCGRYHVDVTLPADVDPAE